MSHKVTENKKPKTTKEQSKKEKLDLFKHWLANPDKRDETLESFARSLGFTGKDPDRTLQRWSKELGFWDEVWQLYTGHYLQGALPKINRKVIEKAKKGDRWAVELVYHLGNRLAKRLGEEETKLPDKVVIIVSDKDRTEDKDS